MTLQALADLAGAAKEHAQVIVMCVLTTYETPLGHSGSSWKRELQQGSRARISISFPLLL